jgi:uncharacterized membrane protein YhaH (DUF805 family)
MIQALFSFRGRLSRLPFILSSLGLGAGMVVLVLAAVSAFLVSRAHGGASNMIPVWLAMLAAVPVFLWVSLALQARRFRDIGWDPVYVIPGWIGFGFVDKLAVLGAPALAVSPHIKQTLLYVLVDLALGGCLLFWPGEGDEDATPSVGADRPPPSGPITGAAPSSWGATPARSVFGRRGL